MFWTHFLLETEKNGFKNMPKIHTWEFTIKVTINFSHFIQKCIFSYTFLHLHLYFSFQTENSWLNISFPMYFRFGLFKFEIKEDTIDSFLYFNCDVQLLYRYEYMWILNNEVSSRGLNNLCVPLFTTATIRSDGNKTVPDYFWEMK